MITQTSIFDYALTYASYGYKLLPLKGKRPTLPNWPNTASNDVADLHKWFNHANPPNIGILTGAPSGIIVFDIDTKPGKQGAEHLSLLEEKYGPLPMTYEVISGSGGWHLYFKYPSVCSCWMPNRRDGNRSLRGSRYNGDCGRVVHEKFYSHRDQPRLYRHHRPKDQKEKFDVR